VWRDFGHGIQHEWNYQADRLEDGVNRQVYLVNDQDPGPIIEVDEGDDLEVFVKNDLPVDITLRWHGERPLQLFTQRSTSQIICS
jgi:FtsP/CotA-like multicopper oxidase with cupredoxin domain